MPILELTEAIRYKTQSATARCCRKPGRQDQIRAKWLPCGPRRWQDPVARRYPPSLEHRRGCLKARNNRRVSDLHSRADHGKTLSAEVLRNLLRWVFGIHLRMTGSTSTGPGFPLPLFAASSVVSNGQSRASTTNENPDGDAHEAGGSSRSRWWD